MSGFADTDAVQAVVERIGKVVFADARQFLLGAAEASSNPDRALVNFERWIAATGSPPTMYESLTSSQELGRLLVVLLGASHQIADVLVQNPELATTVLDPAVLEERPQRQRIAEHAGRLIGESSSYRHSLDRLRFMKQSWHVRIAAADLAGLWPEEQVWLGLSEVADALVSTACELVWTDGNAGECPVSVVAMGKLGGQELNFSSDIDLVYVLDDAADEATEKRATKFCERLTRALSDRMGRGSLYRVDLRLRPYGASGPILPRMAAVEGYYRRYAESWEHLALVRSRPLFASREVTARWSAMRDEVCFQPVRGEWVVQDLMKMRARIEGQVGPSDIKRAPGGIRDVEFLVQILQLLYGAGDESLRTLSTCGALRALGKSGVLAERATEELLASYTFLRQVEHRIQLLGDLQTHEIPGDPIERSHLARRMGFQALEPFDAAVSMHRSHARNWYQAVLNQPDVQTLDDRSRVLDRCAAGAGAVSAWIDGLPQSEAFYKSLLENDSSLDRVLAIVEAAPSLVPQLRQRVSVTEQVLSGEVLEPFDPGDRFANLPDDKAEFASIVRRGWLRIAARAALVGAEAPGGALSELMDAALGCIYRGAGAEFQVVALGSYAARELALFSDLDLLFLCGSGVDEERAAQRLLTSVQTIRSLGAPIEIDLRLRPEGKKGHLVVSEEAFDGYAATRIEPWERLALGRARPLFGTELPGAVVRAAFGRPLDGQTLASLRHTKRRVEKERVPVQHRHRHIKLGAGGQDDVLWTVQLLWWRNYAELDSGAVSTHDRALILAKAGVVNAVERDTLTDAWNFYADLRTSLGLLGHSDEVLPENPERLARLAAGMGLGGPNGALEAYGRHAARVRALLEQTWERLEG